MSDFKDSMSLFGDELFDDPDSVLSTPDDEKGIILNERYGDQKDSLKRKMRILIHCMVCLLKVIMGVFCHLARQKLNFISVQLESIRLGIWITRNTLPQGIMA